VEEQIAINMLLRRIPTCDSRSHLCREAIRDFLKRKWARELDYRLEKNLWCFTQNRIAVRF
jgi:nuclear transport factor 2 (NTF2) superfamily protein